MIYKYAHENEYCIIVFVIELKLTLKLKKNKVMLTKNMDEQNQIEIVP